MRTLSLIFLWKISFLAQRVYVSEILRHFSQFYPTHSRLVYDPTGTILAFLYGEVPHMLPAKYQPNPPGGSGEEDFWRVFTIFGHGDHLEFRIETILAIFVPPVLGCYIWNLVTFGPVVSEEKSFESVDGRRMTRTTEAYHTISSPGAFGSGELTVDLIPKIIMAIYTSAIYSMTNINTLAHIFFQTSFSQRYVEIEKRAYLCKYPSNRKAKNTGWLIFISNSYMKHQNSSIFASSALCHP